MQVKTHIHTDIGLDRHIDRGVDRHIGTEVDRYIDRGDRQRKYAGTNTQTEGKTDKIYGYKCTRQKERLTNIQVQTHRQKDKETD
jgi:hypothetical protein